MRRNAEIQPIHSDDSATAEVQWCSQIGFLVAIAVTENGTHPGDTFVVVAIVAVLRWQLKPLSLCYKSTSHGTFLLVNSISQREN